MKNKKGITLIALVITIIVLLILAGVSLTLVLGENGILNQATNAVTQDKKSTEKQEVVLAWASAESDYYEEKVANSELVRNAEFFDRKLKIYLSSTGHNITVSNGEKEGTYKIEYISNNQNIPYKFIVDANGNIEKVKTVDEYPEVSVNEKATEISKYVSGEFTAVIPIGYTVSNIANEQSIENGLVVKDESDNEWVWIPVSKEELDTMFAKDEAGWIMNGTEEEDAVITNYKANSGTVWDGYYHSTTNRVDPGMSDLGNFREPDLVTGKNNSSYDKSNWRTAGFNSYLEMAESFRNDFANMVESIKNYGGFYIGRYELGKDSSNKPQEKAGSVINRINWYNAYAKCKVFENNNVYSRMIWGSQWDQVCMFINQHGDKVSLTDSRSYGNFANSIGDAELYHGESNFNDTTGRNSAWKANNIYDIAGNCNEWTQEAFWYEHRIARGSAYGNMANQFDIGVRNSNSTTDSYRNLSTRPVLYIK